MFQQGKARHWGFKTFVAGGIVLGLILLAQTVGTYVYVSGNLVVQEALRDADRRAVSLQRSMRRVDPEDTAAVASVLEELLVEWQGNVRWLRVFGADRTAPIEAGSPSDDPLSSERLRARGNEQAGRPHEVRSTGDASVLVTVLPVRLGVLLDLPDLARRPAWAEIAIDLDSVSASFTALRRNLIIGVTAAFALLGTVILIGLRFPHYLRGKRLESQLELAREVQANLLPSSSSSIRGVDISAECRPAWHVGGDFYDVFETGNGHLALMLGDVSGKGISSAPLMGFIHGAAHSTSWTESKRDHETASERLNDLLHSRTAPERFVSLFWGYLDPDASSLAYINAGHPPPLLFKPGWDRGGAVRLDAGGPVLGAMPGVHYRQATVRVEPGDLLVVYSDGIVEGSDPRGEEFGEARLIEAVRAHWTCAPDAIRDGILHSLDRFTNRGEAEDDQTLLVVRFALDRSDPGSNAADGSGATELVASR